MPDVMELLALDPRPDRRDVPAVEIVVPVYNEAAGLEASVRRLHEYLGERFPLSWLVTIADNASTDQTWGIACRLAHELDGVRVVHLPEKGRGRALRAVWSASAAEVVAYMDVDLSVDLDALLPLVAPLVSGHSDVAIGTRLATGARVVRGTKREVISRAYNLLLRTAFHNGFSDAQCGFKAVRSEVAAALLPLVEDEGWFFDTELLILAEHNGFRIHEVPVDFLDDPDSRVDIVRTAAADLKGMGRMLGRLLRSSLDGYERDSTLETGVESRPYTGAAGARRARHPVGALLLGALPFVVCLATLIGLAWAGIAALPVEAAALTAAGAAARLARFALVRRWVSRPFLRS